MDNKINGSTSSDASAINPEGVGQPNLAIPLSVPQQAQAILSATGVTPHAMTQQFIQLKAAYLVSQGIEIGG